MTARAIELDGRVRSTYLSIAESGALVGSVQVRNLATVGGNLCNAAPSADMAPPLLALDAEAVIAGPRGQRRVPLASFFTGVRRTVLAPNELLVEIDRARARAAQRRQLPPPYAAPGARHRGGRRGLADHAHQRRVPKARIALASVAPTPVRAMAAEQALVGPAGDARR